MRKYFAGALLCTVFALPASAEVIDYAQLSGGVTLQPDLGFHGFEYEMDNGFNACGQFGWDATSQLDVGLDFFFTSADYSGYDTGLESASIMAAATYYFDLGERRFQPFVGAGLGAVHVTYVDADPYSGADWQFGFQLQTGVLIPTRFSFDLIFAYRYQWAGDSEIQGSTGIEYQSHNLSFGFLFDL